MTTVAEEADDPQSLEITATRSDRTTEIGKMIDAYLKNTAEMDDRAIHLLFSANRWECA
jgi:thymidylate kinase